MVSGVFDDADSIGDTLKDTGSEYYWLPVTVKVCGTCWVADKLLWTLDLLWQLPLTNLTGIYCHQEMKWNDGVLGLFVHIV